MIIDADLVEDFSQSLTELHEVLYVRIREKDTLHKALVHDARIFSFLRASQVLRSLIVSIHRENSEQYYRADIESMVFSLCMLEIIDEDQAEHLLRQFDLADFYVLDRAWLDSEEDRRMYEGGLHELPSYWRTMSQLFDTISREYTLLKRNEKPHEGH